MQSVAKRAERSASVVGRKRRRVTVTETGLRTVYSFRGPRSHRPVEVSVPHGFYGKFCEERALETANKKILRSWIEAAMRLGRETGSRPEWQEYKF